MFVKIVIIRRKPVKMRRRKEPVENKNEKKNVLENIELLTKTKNGNS